MPQPARQRKTAGPPGFAARGAQVGWPPAWRFVTLTTDVSEPMWKDRSRPVLRLLFMLMMIATPAAADCVILLHGLGRGSGTWLRLAPALQDDGHRVVNLDYASTDFDIATLAEAVLPDAIATCPGTGAIHVVTHSMGGILLRQYMAQADIPRFGRAVMIAPPNKGSEIVDTLGDLAAFEWINGPAGRQLGTGPDSVPNRLGPVTFEVGVIAGSTAYNPIFDVMIPGENDGKVSVESTRVAGMADHIVMDGGHTFIAMRRDVIDQVRAFLANGRFNRN